MRRTSFIFDLISFGLYPTAEDLDELHQNGVKAIINLTEAKERKFNYTDNPHFEYISYPIPDNDIPFNTKTLESFLESVANLLKDNKKIYIHCRHGRGRSTMITMLILLWVFIPERSDAAYEQASHIVNEAFHNGHGVGGLESNLPHFKQRIFIRNWIGYNMGYNVE